jgi:nucleotide-binding universal stress UspA family protein
MDSEPVVLVAVNDSEPAFAAARVAVEYAAALAGRVHVISVVEPFERAHHTYAADADAHRRTQEAGAAAACRYTSALADRAGVPAVCVIREGAVAAQVVAEAEASGAALVVLARVSRPGQTLRTLGSQTLLVLEFAPVPVLVVPTQPR